jgi:hypothetical protein
MDVFSIFYNGATTLSSKQHLSCTHEAEWTPFKTHYFSENLVAPGIEPGPLDLLLSHLLYNYQEFWLQGKNVDKPQSVIISLYNKINTSFSPIKHSR